MRSAVIALVLILGGVLAPSWLIAAEQPAENIKRSTPVGVGDPAPDFTLADQNGRKHTLSAEWKTRPIVLVFYRGYW